MKKYKTKIDLEQERFIHLVFRNHYFVSPRKHSKCDSFRVMIDILAFQIALRIEAEINDEILKMIIGDQ